MLSYILEVTLCWGVFYLLYWLLLSRETFFHFNRWYLLSTFALSLAIPNIAWRLPQPVVESELAIVYFQPITVGVEALEVTVTAAELTPSIGVKDVLIWLYWLGVAWFALRFLVGLTQIILFYRKSERQQRYGYELVLSDRAHAPFSFFNRLFLSKAIELAPEDRDNILRHELAHIRGGHSYDVLLLELTGIFFWCSPLVYLYRRSLRNVHEYIADATVLRTTQKKQYGHLLIRQSQSGHSIAIANHFHSQLKKRILMMMRNPSKRRAMLKYLLAIPLTLAVVLVFSNADAQASLKEQAQDLQQQVEQILAPAKDTLPHQEPIYQMTRPAPNFEIYYPDGNVVKLPAEQLDNGLINIDDYIRPELVEKIDVNRADKLTRVWLKESIGTPPGTAKIDDDEDITFKIVYPNGDVIHLFDTKKGNSVINDMISPDDIKAIDVNKTAGNVITIHMKKNRKVTARFEMDEGPVFAGCENLSTIEERRACSEREMLLFIYKNIKYPAEARTKSIQGTVYVQYQIDEQGFVKDAKIEQGIGGGCDEEVLRVLKAMPRWTPARKDGKAIAANYLMLPVNYKLEGSTTPGKFLPDQAMRDTIITIDPNTYEQKMTVQDWSQRKVSVTGYGSIAMPPPPPSASTPLPEGVFKVVEEMPRFPGCEDVQDQEARNQCAQRKMLEFIYSNIKYPKEARDAAVEGIVVVTFIVETDGSLSDIKTVRSIGSGCDEEALRIVQLMNNPNMRWVPGKQRGQAMRVQFNLPIRYKLEATFTESKETPAPPSAKLKLPDNTLILSNFRANPNPSNGLLNLNFQTEAKPLTISVSDLSGRMIQTIQVNDFNGNYSDTLDLSRVPKGVVLLQIRQGERLFTEKIVLQ